MKNDLIVILAHQRKTVADVHQATGISIKKITNIYYERTDSIDIQTILKICDYLNITLEEFLGREIHPVRNQNWSDIQFNELMRREVIRITESKKDNLIRKEEKYD